MPCSNCKTTTPTYLVETYPERNAIDSHPSKDPISSHVCALCLIGSLVPVFRPYTKQWEFGMVVEFYKGDGIEQQRDARSVPGQHLLRFMDDACDWVYVEATAYAQYVDHFAKQRLQDDFLRRAIIGSHDKGHLNFSPSEDSSSCDEIIYALHHTGDAYDPIAELSVHSFETASISSGQHVPRTPSTQVEHPDAKNDVMEVEQFLETPSRGDMASLNKLVGMHTPDSRTSGMSSLSLSTTGGCITGDDISTPERSMTTITPTRSQQTSKKRKGGAGSDTPTTASSKYNQRLWGTEEDKSLLNAIASQHEVTLKWSVVSKSVPGRTGKQCRERYLNHLTPNIKNTRWSHTEDALIFRLYHQFGTKWSLMSKILRGRTDNGIKNRYHHLKRRLEREMDITPSSSELSEVMQKLKTDPLLVDTKCDDWMLKYLATVALMPRKKLDVSEAAGYLRKGKGEPCMRCALLVPSPQTGRLVCKRSGWCEVCIKTSPCATGSMLLVTRSSTPAAESK